MGEPRVRFDDLRSDPPRSFAMAGFERELLARRSEDVPSVIAGVEEETQKGRYAAGFISYEPAPANLDAFYADLCLAQTASYCASIETDDFAVLSASPELFFEIDGNRIATRPMKGTIARGRTLEEDEAAAERLAASRKDRAEN